MQCNKNNASEISVCVKPSHASCERVLFEKAQYQYLELLNLASTFLGTRVHTLVPTVVKVQYFSTW